MGLDSRAPSFETSSDLENRRDEVETCHDPITCHARHTKGRRAIAKGLGGKFLSTARMRRPDNIKQQPLREESRTQKLRERGNASSTEGWAIRGKRTRLAADEGTSGVP